MSGKWNERRAGAAPEMKEDECRASWKWAAGGRGMQGDGGTEGVELRNWHSDRDVVDVDEVDASMPLVIDIVLNLIALDIKRRLLK